MFHSGVSQDVSFFCRALQYFRMFCCSACVCLQHDIFAIHMASSYICEEQRTWRIHTDCAIHDIYHTPTKTKKSATHLPMIEQKRSTDRLSSPVSFSLEVCYFCYFFENIPRCVFFLFAIESFTRSFFGIQKLFCTIQSISRWMCLVVFWVSFTRLYW